MAINRKNIVILRGLPGSGKTTYAKKWIHENSLERKRISKDDLRSMLVNGEYDPISEIFVQHARDALIETALNAGHDVIVDDTNLNPKHIETIKVRFQWRANIEIKDFTDVPLETCIERDKTRAKPVGEQVIRDMHSKYLKDDYPNSFN